MLPIHSHGAHKMILFLFLFGARNEIILPELSLE